MRLSQRMLQALRNWWGRRRRQRMAVTAEGWYYLAVMAFVLVGALLRQINLLVVLFGMMVGPMLISARLVRMTLYQLQVRRRVPRDVCCGDWLQVELELTNGRRWFPNWCVSVVDTLQRVEPCPGERIEAEVRFTYLLPGKSRQGFYRGPAEQRGRYRFGPLQLVTRFPFGLLRYSVTLDAADTIVVFPRLGKLSPRWRLVDLPGVQGAGTAERRQGLLEGDFYGLRDWRHGDNRSRIHWRTSARRQSLVVRQFERHRNDDLLLVVDAWQPPAATDDDSARVEQLLSAAATLLVDSCRRQGRRVRLVLAAETNCQAGGVASLPVLYECLEALALARPTAADHLTEALLQATQDAPHTGRTIVLSTRSLDLAGNFSPAVDDPRFRGAWGRATVLEVGTSAFDELFILDEPPAAASHGGPPRQEVAHAG